MIRVLIFTLALVTTAITLPISSQDDVTTKIEEPTAGVQIKEQYTEPDAVKPVSAQVENTEEPSQENPAEKHLNDEAHIEEPKVQLPDVQANEKYTEVADTVQPVFTEVANPKLQISQNVNPDQKYTENSNVGHVNVENIEPVELVSVKVETNAAPEVKINEQYIGQEKPVSAQVVTAEVPSHENPIEKYSHGAHVEEPKEAQSPPEVQANEKYADVATASENKDVQSKTVISESVFPVLVDQTSVPPQVVDSGVQVLSVLPISQEYPAGEIVEPIFVPTKLLSGSVTYMTIEPILPQFSRSDVDNEKQQATQLASVDCSPVESHSSKTNQQVFGVHSVAVNAENTQQQVPLENQASEKKQESPQQVVPVIDEHTSVEVNQQANAESYVTKNTESKAVHNEGPVTSEVHTPVQSQVIDSKQQPYINPQEQVKEVEKPAL